MRTGSKHGKKHRLGVIQPCGPEGLYKCWHRSGKLKRWGRKLLPLSPHEDGFEIDYVKDLIRLRIDYLCSLLDETGAKGIELALLPEDQFDCWRFLRRACRDVAAEVFTFAEKEYLPKCRALARKHCMVIASCFYRAEGNTFGNDCVIIGHTGRTAGVYRKTHLPGQVQDQEISEAACFHPGDSLEPIRTRVGKIGVLTCLDILFPEAAACYGLKGVDLLLHPSVGYSFADEEEDLAQARLRVRASDVQVPLLFAIYGTPGAGMSCVIGANGSTLACAGKADEAIVFADVEVGAPRLSNHWYKGYHHRKSLASKRRPDLYRVLTRKTPPILEE